MVPENPQVKTMVRRLLVHAALDVKWWAYAALHACEVLCTKWLQKKWTYPSFGDHVVARLVHKDSSGLVPKGSVGKLLLFRATGDKSSELLIGEEVVRGGLPVSVRDIPSLEERPLDDSNESGVTEVIQSQWERILSPGGRPLWLNKSTKVVQTTEPHVILPAEGHSEADPEQRPEAYKAEDAGPTRSVTLTSPTMKKVDVAVPVDTAWERVGKKGLAHAVPVTPRSVQDTKGSEKTLWR